MGCAFEENQIVRAKENYCPVVHGGLGTGIKVGQTLVVSEVDSEEWNVDGLVSMDCWPIRFYGVRFERDEWCCACQYEPIEDAVPDLISKHTERPKVATE